MLDASLDFRCWCRDCGAERNVDRTLKSSKPAAGEQDGLTDRGGAAVDATSRVACTCGSRRVRFGVDLT